MIIRNKFNGFSPDGRRTYNFGGGGGGAPQPTSTTAYQTNLPEYAKPYVMNMLGAAQNQLFETTPGADGAPGEITGFRPYTPYSTDPTKYFAGPTGLQQSVYSEAGQMQTPSTFAPAMGIAGMAGMGQLGAGQQYARQVTDPRSMQAYMSPYQQSVTDIAKMNAVREAQLAGQQANLGAARQGTYGGARQALMGAEREKNLLANLSNIQAQGSQSAFDKAMQAQQFGANLGLQGLQGATSTAGTLAGIGGQQQQADLARMGFQQQTGKEQQAYQQNIINQAIQDYATAQQYPYMQLSTMSNLLRGLPMQGMTTQQYQAQPSTLQQGIGLLGTGASLYGAFGRKEGGTIKEYAAGGGVKASLENKIDDIADAGGVKGLQALFAQTKSPAAKELIMERMREEGISAAPTGGLGRNMAGGGIVAFAAGDLVDEDYDYNYSGYGRDLGIFQSPAEKAAEERKRKETFLAENAPEALAAMRKREAEPKTGFTESSFKDFDQAQALFEKERYGTKPPVAAPAAAGVRAEAGPTGLAAVLEQRRKMLGIDGPGEKNEAFMKALEERQAGLGKQNESDRYLRAAEAFARFGSTAGPIGKAASEALGGFAKGEAAARKDQDKMQMEGMKMQADLEKARRAEERGDLDAAEKFYTSAEDRRAAMARVLAAGSKEEQLVERAMKDPKFMEALRSTKGLDSRAQQAALVNYTKWESSAALTDPEYRKRAKAAKGGDPQAAQALIDYKENVYNQFLTRAGGPSPTGGGSGKVIDFNAIK
jgi:hypothetical protein